MESCLVVKDIEFETVRECFHSVNLSCWNDVLDYGNENLQELKLCRTCDIESKR
jgi:hypothetical protein